MISWGRIQWKRKELEQRPAGACPRCFPEGEEGKQLELISEGQCWAGRKALGGVLLPEN